MRHNTMYNFLCLYLITCSPNISYSRIQWFESALKHENEGSCSRNYDQTRMKEFQMERLKNILVIWAWF
jgi:hypothetical protein